MSKAIKSVYILLVLALILQPHFSRHITGTARPYIESIVTVLILGIICIVYFLGKKAVAARDEKLKVSTERLADTSSYIGKMNCRLDLLPALTTGLVGRRVVTKNQRKEIFTDILNVVAASIVKTDWAMLRFIHRDSHRVIMGFYFAVGKDRPIIRESELSRQISGKNSGSLNETLTYDIIVTSDQNADIQAHLILPMVLRRPTDEYSILQAITDQAQLLYNYNHEQSPAYA